MTTRQSWPLTRNPGSTATAADGQQHLLGYSSESKLIHSLTHSDSLPPLKRRRQGMSSGKREMLLSLLLLNSSVTTDHTPIACNQQAKNTFARERERDRYALWLLLPLSLSLVLPHAVSRAQGRREKALVNEFRCQAMDDDARCPCCCW